MAALVVGLTGGLVAADTITAYRARHQKKRIKQGVQSGQVTKPEARELHAEQKDIRHARRESKEDGVVTHNEKVDVRQMQNQAGKDIHQATHNKRVRKH